MTVWNPFRKPWRKRLLVLVAIVVAVLCLGGALVQTPIAKHWIAGAVSRAASGAAPFGVVIEDLRGIVPFNLSLGTLRLSDADGTWLEARELEVRLSATALLHGRVVLQLVRAASIDVARLPVLPESEPRPEGPLVFPAVPQAPAWLEIGALELERVSVGAPLAGEAVALTAEAAYGPRGDMAGQRFTLRIRRIDDAEGSVELDVAQSGDSLATHLAISDARLAGALLHAPGAFALAFDGEGPLTAWRGQVRVSLAGETLTSARVALGYGETPRLALDGALETAHPLTPEQARQATGGAPLAYKLAANIDASRLVTVEQCNLNGGSLHSKAAGSMSLADLRTDLSLDLRHGNLNDFLEAGEPAEAVPVSLHASAKGTPAALDFSLDGTLADAPALRGTGRLQAEGARALDAQLEVLPPAALLPGELQRFLEGGVRAQFDARQPAPGQWQLQTLTANLAAGNVEGSGMLDTGARTLDGTLSVHVADASRFGAFTEAPLEGSGDLNVAVRGTAAGIVAKANLDARGLVAGATKVASAALAFDAALGWLDAPLARLRVSGGGTVQGVAPEGFDARDVDVTVDIDAPKGQDILIREAALKSVWGTASATGHFDAGTRAGEVTLTLDTPDAAPLLALAGTQGQGALRGEVRAVSSAPWPSIDTTVRLRADKLANFPEPLPGLLGAQAELDAAGAFKEGAAVLERLSAKTGTATLSGQGKYALETHALEGDLEVSLADLAPLGALTGRGMGGSATVTLTAAGTAEDIRVAGKAALQDPRLSPAGLDTLALEFNAEGLPKKARGSVTLTGTRQDRALEARAEASLGGKVLEVPAFTLRAGENAATGSADFDLEAVSGHGNLSLDCPELNYIGALLGMRLEGSLSGEGTLEAEKGQGTLRVTLNGADIASDFVEIGQLHADAAATGPERLVLTRFEASAGQLRAGETRIAEARFSASGDAAEVLRASSSFKATLPSGAPLEAHAEAEISGNLRQVTISKLEGSAGAYPFALAQPATASWDANSLNFNAAGISLGEGSLDASGTYGADQLDVRASWRELPLAFASLVAEIPVDGIAEGNLSLAGTPAEPRADLRATIRDLRGGEMDPAGPALQTEIGASLTSSALLANASATMPGALDLKLDFETNPGFRLAPFTFSLPSTRGIGGSIEAHSDLARLVAALHLPGQEASGQLDANLKLGGVLAVPELRGQATVKNGGYTNIDTGTALRNIEAVIEAAGREVTIAKLSGNGPAKGTFDATGRIAVPAGQTPSVKFDTTMRALRFADRSDFTGVIDGTVGIAGDLDSLLVKGDLVVGPVVVRMPSQLPPQQLTPVDIELANGPPPPAESKAPAGTSKINLDLHVSSPGRVTIEGPVLNTEWTCDLHILGNLSDPRLDGRLDVLRGSMDFLGRRFDVADSRITFDKSRPPDPYLNFKAQSNAHGIKALLNLTGTFDALQIALTSEPAYPPDEVLARILFGRGLSDITPVQALQLVRAAELLRGKKSAARLFAGDVRSPRLDHFEVRSGGATGETVVVVGQYVTDSVYVELQQGAGADSSKAQVEAEITPQFSIEGSTEATGATGMGVLWKKDF